MLLNRMEAISLGDGMSCARRDWFKICCEGMERVSRDQAEK